MVRSGLLPQPFGTHRLLEAGKGGRISKEDIQTRVQAIHAVHHQRRMHEHGMRQRIPGRRLSAHHEALEHGKESHGSDTRRTVEIHGAAALTCNLGKAQIEGRSGRGRKRNQRRCGGFLRERLVRDAMNRVDVRPSHMLLAQPVGAAIPTRFAQRTQQAREIGARIRITDPHQRIRRFCFGRPNVRVAVESQQVRHDVVRGGQDQSGLPAEGRRGVAHRGDGVPAIMLAVSPRAHAVFPRFAPVNRADADQNSVAAKRCSPMRIVDCGALFE